MYLLKAAGVNLPSDTDDYPMNRQETGAGLGLWEQNRKVEKAAMKAATDFLKRKG